MATAPAITDPPTIEQPYLDSAPNRSAAVWPVELREILIDQVETSDNVRADVGDVSELAASIESVGMLQPILVEEIGAARYGLIFGHRRVAAARHAGLKQVPALIEAGGRGGRPIRQLVENLQRADLNAIDTAKAYRALLDTGLSQRQLAEQLGISQPTIANTLRLLKAPDVIQERVAAGELTRSHAEVISKLPDGEQKEVARRIVEHDLSVDEVRNEIALAARRASEEQSREERFKNDEARRLQTVIDLLAKKKADPQKVTLVGYAGASGDVLEKLKPLGWKVKIGDAETPAKGICDCTALRLSFRYEWPGGKQVEKASLAKMCISSKHQAAARKAAEAERQAAQEAAAAERAKAEEERDALLAPAVTAVTMAIPPAKAKLLLMALIAGERHGNGWWSASAWMERVSGKAASYDGWMVQLWKAIDGLEHERLLAEIARIVAERILDAGPDPARDALSSLYNAGERVAASRAAKAKS